MVTPAQGLPSGLRIRTKSPWTPSSLPRTSKRANTTAQAAWTAPLVIQYLDARTHGVCRSQVWVDGS